MMFVACNRRGLDDLERIWSFRVHVEVQTQEGGTPSNFACTGRSRSEILIGLIRAISQITAATRGRVCHQVLHTYLPLTPKLACWSYAEPRIPIVLVCSIADQLQTRLLLMYYAQDFTRLAMSRRPRTRL